MAASDFAGEIAASADVAAASAGVAVVVVVAVAVAVGAELVVAVADARGAASGVSVAFGSSQPIASIAPHKSIIIVFMFVASFVCDA